MTSFWGMWVMILIVVNLGITLFLFLWGMRVRIPTLADGTSGHVWAHGVLREGVRKLPLWWVLVSAGMFVAGIGYLVLYPGFGKFNGVLDWTSQQQLAQDTAANDSKLDATMSRFALGTVEQLANDGDATRIGQRLFVDNCAACHGRDGHGNAALGAPNLVDQYWLYGGSGDAIMTSIVEGRHGVMPAFDTSFDAAGVTNLANYVLSLSGAGHSAHSAAAGKPLFAVCASCHGVDGKGNPAIGAPNLASATWLYGSDIETIEHTIRHGRGGTMPAWRSRINEAQARLIAAWIYGQSHDGAAR
ncbi:MAG: cytochrome-c oxidase, cbb3-type subunit III [Dokdonella sp.]